MAEALSPALPDDLEQEVSRLLTDVCERELKLATAESCTGGLLASLFTDVPGSSHAFERGFVTYTDEAKHELLGVSQDLLDGPGAVSEPVARSMAEGALAHSRADIALSVTGYAEGGDEGEAGLVHFGAARRGGPTRHREEHFGDIGRAQVRLACLRVALDMLREQLEA